jgi:hypothetical protein
MTERVIADDDPVTRLIKFCHRDETSATRLFQQFISEKKLSVELPEGVVTLTEEQRGEFVQRYSAEVEPTLWESKRRKN